MSDGKGYILILYGYSVPVDMDITSLEHYAVLETSIASVQRSMDSMVKDGIIERKGGKRFENWEIKE